MKRQIFACAALAFFGSTGVGASAVGESTDAGAFFAKHKTYTNWTFGDIQGVELDGKDDLLGKNGVVKKTFASVMLRRGLSYHLSASGENGAGYDGGFTGSIAWSADENGFTAPLYGHFGSTEAAEAGLFAEAFAILPVKSIREVTLDGVAHDVARVSLPDKTLVDLYELPSGAFDRMVVDPDGDGTTIIIDTYAELLPGKKLISAYHYSGSPYRQSFATAKLVTIDDAQLHPPKPRAHWTFGSGAIPVEITPHNRFLISAVINGVRGRFMLDTGAGGIFLNGAFVGRAHLTHVGTGTSSSFAGSGKLTYDRADTIAFDDGSVLSDATIFTTRGDPSGQDGHLDGLIGTGILMGTIATLDLDTAQLTLDDPATNSVADSAAALTAFVDLSEGVPVVPVKLNGNVSVNALLDSGSPGHVFVDRSLLKRVPLLVDHTQLSSEMTYVGADGGSETMDCGHIASINLGPIEYQNPSTCFAESVDGALIGFDFLKNFNITFDYPAGKIVFQQRKT